MDGTNNGKCDEMDSTTQEKRRRGRTRDVEVKDTVTRRNRCNDRDAVTREMVIT